MAARLFLCVAALLPVSMAHAVLVNVDPAKNGGDFISGTGIPGDNATSDTSMGTGESVYLKARSRDTGQALSISGSTYTVLAGLASDNANPWWSFDYQFTPGTAVAGPEDYTLTLEVDFNPAVGSETYKTLSLPVGDGGDMIPLNAWDDTDGYFTNPGGGAWTDNTTPYVVANSWHLSMGFWSIIAPLPVYDPNAVGEYKINLSVSTVSGPIASTSIIANVVAVPEAGQIALMGVASLCCGLAAYWKRK